MSPEERLKKIHGLWHAIVDCPCGGMCWDCCDHLSDIAELSGEPAGPCCATVPMGRVSEHA